MRTRWLQIAVNSSFSAVAYRHFKENASEVEPSETYIL
jgi:hypothetical protein